MHGADYEALAIRRRTFTGLVGRGGGETRRGRAPEGRSKRRDFRAAMAWLMQQAENAVGRQRYKGPGRDEPEQLWETTMDPTVRRLLRVQIEDAIEADRVFTMLMGDEVRRDFIERQCTLRAGNIDVRRTTTRTSPSARQNAATATGQPAHSTETTVCSAT